uniref:Growth arrest-specific 1a n=1 Tax=Nothobranchius rachovii TaxID=451742 RepID=A0A1A8SHC2_9TELE
MANSRALQTVCRSVWPLGCALLIFGYLCVATPPHGRRLVCWQAIMICHQEPSCNYAYEHYSRACGSVLSGQRRKCPSHCISSLVQLNLTKSGPALEDCSCGQDSRCQSIKRAIEPCLPRTTSTGCTEARLQCQRDRECSSAMQDYLHHCGKLFSGETCSNACRNVIAKMRKHPTGQKLDSCVCDGPERNICEFVKSSMRALCFDDPDPDYEQSGSDDGSDEENDDWEKGGPEELGNGASITAAACARTLLASILALLALF